MKRTAVTAVLFGVIICVLAACAPAAGRPIVQYKAQAPDLISTIAELGVQLQPSSSYNFYSVSQISDRYIQLRASTVGGITFFFGGSTSVVTFTASQNGDVVNLAASANGELGNKAIDKILLQLDTKYQRLK